MKLTTFEVTTPVGPVRRIGAVVDDHVVDLATAFALHLERVNPGSDAERVATMFFPPDMVAFLGMGALGMDAARHALDEAAHEDNFHGIPTRHALSAVRTLAPLTRPRALRDFLTFEGHMKNASRALGRGDQIPQAFYDVPAYYKGVVDTVSGPDETITIPPYTEKFDFELELAVVIGARGKDISLADAGRYIAGYTIWNDFSARDQQMREGPVGMGPSKGKDFDGGNALGPYLVTPDELDIDNLRMTARVNGETWTDSSSANRQFSFDDLIVHVSQSQTIYAGEVWGSGTVTGGCGLETGRWLKAGDLVELEIEGIGVLSNRLAK